MGTSMLVAFDSSGGFSSEVAAPSTRQVRSGRVLDGSDSLVKFSSCSLNLCRGPPSGELFWTVFAGCNAQMYLAVCAGVYFHRVACRIFSTI